MIGRTHIRTLLRLGIAALPLTLTSCSGGQMLLIPTGLIVRGAATAAAFAIAAVWLRLLVRSLAPDVPPSGVTRHARWRPLLRPVAYRASRALPASLA